MYNDRFKRIFQVWIVLSILAVVSTAALGYYLFHPQIPIVVNSATINGYSVQRGDVLTYNFNYCKYVDKFATVYRQLRPVDTTQQIVAIPAIEGVTVRGCHTAVIPMLVPASTAPGVYTLSGHLVYQLNAFETTSIDYTTSTFTITK